MRSVLLLITGLLVLVAMFAIQNPGIIEVHFLQYKSATSLLIVIVLSFGVGVLVGFLGGVPSSLRKSRRIRELSYELETAQKPSGTSPTPTVP